MRFSSKLACIIFAGGTFAIGAEGELAFQWRGTLPRELLLVLSQFSRRQLRTYVRLGRVEAGKRFDVAVPGNGRVAVTGEVVAQTKGPKLRIHKFKNKTGYHKRQGHRQPLTQVRVTGISTGK